MVNNPQSETKNSFRLTQNNKQLYAGEHNMKSDGKIKNEGGHRMSQPPTHPKGDSLQVAMQRQDLMAKLKDGCN